MLVNKFPDFMEFLRSLERSPKPLYLRIHVNIIEALKSHPRLGVSSFSNTACPQQQQQQ
jgi:hypothetical protein